MNHNNNHHNRARNPQMQNVLALQALAVDETNFIDGGGQSQVTQGPACSSGSISCVPPGACETAFNLI